MYRINGKYTIQIMQYRKQNAMLEHNKNNTMIRKPKDVLGILQLNLSITNIEDQSTFSESSFLQGTSLNEA